MFRTKRGDFLTYTTVVACLSRRVRSQCHRVPSVASVVSPADLAGVMRIAARPIANRMILPKAPIVSSSYGKLNGLRSNTGFALFVNTAQIVKSILDTIPA
jgi:hypothetical protein